MKLCNNVLFKIKTRFLAILLETAVIYTIIILSMRAYLFGNGFFSYSDQTWPPNINEYPSGIFSTTIVNGGYPNLLQFTRDFLTWPYYISTFIFHNPIVVEKLFILSVLSN